MAPSSNPTAHARRLDRLIVTRPAPEAQVWVKALREQGWPAHALPLIHIGEPKSPAEREGLRHWRLNWPQADAILFVSGAAVGHFFRAELAPTPAGLKTRFWAPGPGTARLLASSLERLGIDTARIDAPADDAAQFDSEHLWPQVVAQVGPGRLVLVVRGVSHGQDGADAGGVAGSGRDWLIRQCLTLGAQVEGCVAYARRSPVLTRDDEALIHAAAEPGSAWLFSSSEALRTLSARQPAAGWSHSCALATHPRIAHAAKEAGFGEVLTTRPSLGDVMRTLESAWYRP